MHFVFAVKAGRFITHVKRLKEVETPVANFFASGILRLREKLGPILWQLPPSVRYDRSRLEAFFGLLPRGAAAAEALARRHDARLNQRAWTESAGVGKLRHALEVRHGSFENSEFVEILREHDIALVVADTAGKWPLIEDLTSDFVYVRLHGDAELYASGYSPAVLNEWARKVRAWKRGQTPGVPGCSPHGLTRDPGAAMFSSILTTMRRCVPLSMPCRLPVSCDWAPPSPTPHPPAG